MININSDQGRVGQLWWFNSDTKPRRFDPGTAPHLALEGIPLIQWGTFGFGRNVSISLVPYAHLVSEAAQAAVARVRDDLGV